MPKPTTAVERVQARLQGKGPKGGSARIRGGLPFRHVEVTLNLHYGDKEHRYTRTFQLPAHKNADANSIRTKLTAEAIASAKRENAAFGAGLRVTLHDYRVV